MGTSTLFDEYRDPQHVLCGRLLLVALIPGLIGMASEHWLQHQQQQQQQQTSSASSAPPASAAAAAAAATTAKTAPATTAAGAAAAGTAPAGTAPAATAATPVWHPGEGQEGAKEGGAWTTYGGRGVTIWHLGLWKVCSNFSRCASLPSDKFPDAYGPVRGVGVISLCLHVLSVLVGLVCSCEDPENLLGVNVYVPRLEEVLALLAGILMGGTLVIFAQTTQQHPVYHTFHPGWSFWLLVIYVCLLLLAGGVIVLVRLHVHCACPKSCSRLCRHHHHHHHHRRRQQTARAFQSLHGTSVTKTDFTPSPLKERSSSTQPLQETRFQFFLEPFDNATGPKSFDGQPTDFAAGKSAGCSELQTGPSPVYRSLDGIPRMVRLSEMSDDVDLV